MLVLIEKRFAYRELKKADTAPRACRSAPWSPSRLARGARDFDAFTFKEGGMSFGPSSVRGLRRGEPDDSRGDPRRRIERRGPQRLPRSLALPDPAPLSPCAHDAALTAHAPVAEEEVPRAATIARLRLTTRVNTSFTDRRDCKPRALRHSVGGAIRGIAHVAGLHDRTSARG